MTTNHDIPHSHMANGLYSNGVVNGNSNGFVNGNSNGLDNAHVSAPVTNGFGHYEHGGESESRPLAPFIPVAICGMACRLPGGVQSPSDLWDFLLAKGDARGLVPETRYNITGYHSRNKQAGTIVSEHGYFLDENMDLAALDTSFFSMSRGEVERLDPQVRMLLEVARESLDDAGEVGWKGKDVGVYVGSYGNDWYDLFHAERQQYGLYQISTTQDYTLSNRLSYEMDLHGPSVTIRTACSSGLVGLDEACAAIAKGDCSSAIVGGTSIIMAPALTAAMSEQGALSPEGSCKTFSAEANGYARGEAIVAIYIKPLADAIRDGSPIQAVIRGTATNDDGKTSGFSVPSSKAQEALIRHTYKVAGIADSDVGRTGFFECHGTGTPIGDPIETQAVARVFGNSGGITIGSLKPNLGHTEGASGLVSLIKAVMMLQKKTILPNIKSLPLNPKIPFKSAGLTVPLEAAPWPEERHERISINSFGIGGSNAHCVIESAANFNLSKSTISNTAARLAPQLLLFSANHPHSLSQMVDNYNSFLDKEPDSLALNDVAYTLAHRREHLPVRSFSVGTRHKPGVATAARTAPVTDKPFSVVMAFTGQGAQWPQMGRELLRHSPVFCATIRSLDSHLQSLKASWKIEEELMKPARTSRINEAEFSQPLCTALQIALVDLLASVGIQPAAVVGHSSGEIAAAYAAGGISARDALTVAFHRGRTAQMAPAGSMAAVGLGRDEVTRFLKPGVVMACDNSPSSVTLSGHTQKLEEVLAATREFYSDREIQTTMLKVERAYHSQYMAIVGGKYVHAMNNAGIRVKQPSVPFFSSVTGKLMDTTRSPDDAVTPFSPEYWQKNLESPVLFKDAVSSIMQDAEPTRRNLLFLEVGPHGALAGPLRQILANSGSPLKYYSVLSRRQNSMESFLTTVGELWASHLPIDFGTLIPPGCCVPHLPLYPWNHQTTYWHESRVSREWRMRSHPYHDLLGVKVPESSDIEPMWRNLLHLNSVPWIRDHKIEDSIVFPFACYVSMAAEAVRQLSGIQQGVEMRRVAVTTALVLQDTDDTPTELITTLKRQRLRDALDSSWWEFSVVSHNTHSWTKHCSGEVRATTSTSWGDGTRSTPADDKVPRRVDMRKWYERVRRGGIQYGPHFISIDSMRTTPGTSGLGRGKGQLRNNWHGDEENYHLHPIVLDTYFQLQSSVAQFGRSHAYTQFIPVSIASLSLSRSPADHLTLESSAELVGDSAVGSGSCTDGSEVILKVSGVRMAPFEARQESGGSGDSASLTARQEWVPHIDFLHFDTVCRPSKIHSSYAPAVDLLAQLAISLAQQRLRQLEPSQAIHMENYKAWISQQKPDGILSGLVETDEETLASQIDSLASMLASSPLASAAAAIQKISTNIKGICSGEKEALEVLISGDTLGKLDFLLRDYDASDLLSHLGHSKPNLRVLELDAGLGDSTARNLQALRRQDGTVLYSQYTCTDRQPAIIRKAQEKFSQVANMEFHTFNIDEDPTEQELDGRQFDLVIAAGVVHKSSDLRRTLENIRTLLAPEGRLFLQQPRPGISWIKFVLGTLPEWWSHDRDDGPHLGEEQWKTTLVQSGFQKLVQSDVVHDQLTTRIVARPQKEETGRSRQVVLLCNAPQSTSTVSMTQELESRGFDVLHRTMNEVLHVPRGRDVISLLDCEKPFLDSMDEASWLRFRSFAESLRDGAHGMFWITKLSHTFCSDPSYGTVFGLARTIRSELGVDFAVCEADDACNKAVVESFTRFHERSDAGDLGTDFEYAISNGVPRVNRFFPFFLEEELKDSGPPSQAVLAISRPGRLGTLDWKSMSTAAPTEGQVEVEVYASGLNFRDVLVAMGIIGVSSRELAFGYEAAGIVRRRGPNATKFEVGDRVMLSGIKTCASTVTCSQTLCEMLADSLSFVEAASLPVVFMTAIYSLINVGRVEKGSSLLIHSGASGVGLASIQIARMLEAEVFTTVSSEAQAEYLMKTHCIQRNRIFHSRDDSFVQALLTATNGNGVDLALNSLSGELLHATWRNCIASWGMMVEIGKRDLVGVGQLDMDVFLANRSYCCVDIDQMREERPELVERLLQRVMKYYREGHIRPIRQDKIANAADAAETFQYMQQRSHMGKVVMRIRDEDTGDLTMAEKIVPARRSVQLNPEASYLLIGGLGGLGRTVAVWMAENGTKHLTFLSRRAGQGPHDQDLRAELEAMGCSVRFERGSVESLQDVKRVIKDSPKPLRGILQMSMVLRNAGFGSMTFEDWQAGTGPKIKGTWNLHTAVEELGIGPELEFFVLFSSLSGVTGQPGQANYAAANSFLDAFAKFRTQRGLTCSVVDIGAMEGVGYLLEHDQMLRKLKGTGWSPVKEEELLEAVGAAMLPRVLESIPKELPANQAISDNSGMLLGIAPATPLGNLESSSRLRRDVRMAIFHNFDKSSTLGHAGSTGNETLTEFLNSAKEDPAILREPETARFLASVIGKRLFSLLLKPEQEPNITSSLEDIGLDSMIAIEMRSWWKQAFGLNISVLEMLGMGTLEALGERVAKELADISGA